MSKVTPEKLHNISRHLLIMKIFVRNEKSKSRVVGRPVDCGWAVVSESIMSRIKRRFAALLC